MCIEQIESSEKTSEALPKIFEQILKRFTCKRVFFARGPGSFMAIKITYIFLRTLAITKGIELFASDGFYFSHDLPIKAMGKLYFVKENGTIAVKILPEPIETLFFLPQTIEEHCFSKEIEPLYILPAI